jgi:DNA-binding NarL/FixJ family response regulator
VIRVALVDDHPAVRAGLNALLRTEPGLSVIPLRFHDELSARDVLSVAPSVALIDGRLGSRSGLGLCLEMSRLRDAPPVVIYSAYVDDDFAVAARLAGAAGALNKAEPLERLLDALRAVASGGTYLPPLAPMALRRSADRLKPDDLPYLSMLAHGTSRGEVADTLAVSREELEERLTGILGKLERPLMTVAHAAA